MLSFGHMLPEAIRNVKSAHALQFALVGYLTMLVVEKIVFTGHEHETNAIVDDCHGLDTSQSSYRLNSAKLLCIAMSVHSFFEAASLALAADSASAGMLAVCIALHQPAESLALAVAFLKSKMSTAAAVPWLVAYSAVTLAGHGAGVLVAGMCSSSAEAALTAITAGTFMYVGATEVSAS